MNRAQLLHRWPFPRLLVHRGGGTLAPENTLAGLRVAARLGCTGVEFDAKLSKDGVVVLMHDDTLDRTTNGHGRVAETDFAAVRSLDAGSWYGGAHAGEPIPTLEAALSLCQELGLWPNIEIKPCPGRDAETGRAVAKLAASSALTHPAPLLSSFSWTALEAAAHVAPHLPRGWLVEAPPADSINRLAALDCRSLHLEHAHASPELIASVHTAGYAVLCYTVNDPWVARRLYQSGLDALVTDRPDLVGAPD